MGARLRVGPPGLGRRLSAARAASRCAACSGATSSAACTRLSTSRRVSSSASWAVADASPVRCRAPRVSSAPLASGAHRARVTNRWGWLAAQRRTSSPSRSDTLSSSTYAVARAQLGRMIAFAGVTSQVLASESSSCGPVARTGVITRSTTGESSRCKRSAAVEEPATSPSTRNRQVWLGRAVRASVSRPKSWTSSGRCSTASANASRAAAPQPSVVSIGEVSRSPPGAWVARSARVRCRSSGTWWTWCGTSARPRPTSVRAAYMRLSPGGLLEAPLGHAEREHQRRLVEPRRGRAQGELAIVRCPREMAPAQRVEDGALGELVDGQLAGEVTRRRRPSPQTRDGDQGDRDEQVRVQRQQLTPALVCLEVRGRVAEEALERVERRGHRARCSLSRTRSTTSMPDILPGRPTDGAASPQSRSSSTVSTARW